MALTLDTALARRAYCLKELDRLPAGDHRRPNLVAKLAIYEARVVGRCRRCGARLSDPLSRQRQLGPCCWEQTR